MRRIIPFLLFISILNPIESAQAVSCRKVADLNEQLRVSGIRDSGFGLNSKESITFTVNVYRTNLQNQNCISSSQVTQTIKTVRAINIACTEIKKSDPRYLEWKKFDRNFWQGMFGKNFKFACQAYKSLKY
jgi:hypothetical protein